MAYGLLPTHDGRNCNASAPAQPCGVRLDTDAVESTVKTLLSRLSRPLSAGVERPASHPGLASHSSCSSRPPSYVSRAETPGVAPAHLCGERGAPGALCAHRHLAAAAPPNVGSNGGGPSGGVRPLGSAFGPHRRRALGLGPGAGCLPGPRRAALPRARARRRSAAVADQHEVPGASVRSEVRRQRRERLPETERRGLGQERERERTGGRAAAFAFFHLHPEKRTCAGGSSTAPAARSPPRCAAIPLASRAAPLPRRRALPSLFVGAREAAIAKGARRRFRASSPTGADPACALVAVRSRSAESAALGAPHSAHHSGLVERSLNPTSNRPYRAAVCD
eukprot:664699-Prorocentrum_minimum.AAC.2